jgi:hypothetical protein
MLVLEAKLGGTVGSARTARKDFPAKDLKEFVAMLRQQGGRLEL